MNNDIINYKSLFIGPKSENKNIFLELLNSSIKSSLESREDNNINEPSYYENDYFNSDDHIRKVNLLKENSKKICNYLKDSIQFSSLKYQAHMIGDNIIPSIIGISASILYNQNTIQHQFSNKLTLLEYTVCNDLNKMIGYNMDNVTNDINDFKFIPLSKDEEKQSVLKEISIVKPFSHISTGGTLSNIEALWCSFFVKCMAISIKNSILNNEFKQYAGLNFKLYNGDMKRILDLTNWELLNIDSDIIVNMPYILSLENGLKFSKVMSKIKKYHISTLGLYEFCTINRINPPVFIAPSTIHYSISKSAIILGIGVKNIKSVNVDEMGKIDLDHLNMFLKECNDNNIPVISLISLLGSTQESAVDNLEEIINIRNQFRLNNNFNFNIHLDAAYGGYYLSVINQHFPLDNPPDQIIFNQDNGLFKTNQSFDPLLIFNQYLIKQFQHAKYCDTITLDPHKTGFIPYSCGVICYRNSKFRDILANAGVYIGGNTINSMGIYGIEGSRSATSSASLYFAHSTIRPSKFGYGYLLSKCLLNSKLLYFKLLHMVEENKDQFNITFTNSQLQESKYNNLKSKLLKSNGDLIDINEIYSNEYLLNELSSIGSDLSVLCFSFNLIINNKLNQDIQLFSTLNNKLIKCFNHLQDPNKAELILSSTIFTESHGEKFISNLTKSIGLTNIKKYNNIKLPFLRICIMDPFLGETNYSFINQIVDIIKKKIILIINNIN